MNTTAPAPIESAAATPANKQGDTTTRQGRAHRAAKAGGAPRGSRAGGESMPKQSARGARDVASGDHLHGGDTSASLRQSAGGNGDGRSDGRAVPPVLPVDADTGPEFTVFGQIAENVSSRNECRRMPAYALSWSDITRLEECAECGSALVDMLEADAQIGGLAGAERLGDRNRAALAYAVSLLFEQVANVAYECAGDRRA